MVQRRRENAARYLYDLSKILFATAMVGNLVAWKQFDVVVFAWRAVATLILFWCGYMLDGVREGG